MNPARNQTQFLWAGAAVGEAEESWQAGRQEQDSISARSPSKHRFRGQVSRAASAEREQRVSGMSSQALALDMEGS